MSDQYLDSNGNRYESLPELVGHVPHTARMKIEETTVQRAKSALQYFGAVPAAGMILKGATLDAAITQTSGGTARIELGYPSNPDAFARWDNGGSGYATDIEKDISDADAAFTDPAILASEVTAGSPTVITLKISEVNDTASDAVKVSGYVNLEFIPLSQVSNRQVRDSDGLVDSDKS